MSFMDRRRGKLIQECRERLITMKGELLNRVREQKKEISSLPFLTGDEADQTNIVLEENSLLISQERAQRKLMEIDLALDRIIRGTFGICEETEEPIEADRLRLIPYTTLSIEGAEIRDARKKLFAK